VVLGQLREAGIVENSAIARAELVAMRTGQPVEQVLNQLGALSDDDLAQAYAQTLGCEVWRPDTVEIDIDLDALGVTVDYLRRARLLPLTMVNRTLVCAACDPLDDEALSGLVFATGRPVKVLAARPGDWRRAFELRHATLEVEAAETDERRLEQEIDQVAEGGVEGAGARLVAIAFEAAIAAGASDIHFEPRRNDFQVRLRIDGRLVDHQTVSADLAGPAVSRVKVIANLDLGERRLPQDGRTTFVIAGRQIDVRVATSPSVFGESAVLRILDRQSVPLDLQTLGFSTLVRGVLQRAATSPHGMFLLTGPTGSGKTTTLYAMLQMFAGSAKKVLSVEDPVEYHFDHVVQTQVAPHIGLTFAAALRSFLRQDPDAILVGEIRDPETAAVAVQAAMTGHFVLASVHANHAVAVAPRLLDMGVEPYQLAAALSGAAAQRLVRRLCHSCRRPTDLTKAEDAFVRAVGFEGVIQGYGPGGCAACRGSGYRGRIAIAEAFIAQEGVLRGIAERQSLPVLSALAAESGLICMAMDGVEKASQGLTTIEEVMAAVHG
jgi:type II secretory ATPase GspE/PulE/Tfp pilus assembly ATPase PilB-like protein